ncbi:MAG: PilX N-terminal domain-containing pilus assembly protein [Pseudomonas sp.]
MTPAYHQRGAALLVALVMLLLLTLVATASLRDSTLHNRLSSVGAERQRAANAAESALREGERRLQVLGNAGNVDSGNADCATSISALAGLVSNLCVLSSDLFADSAAAGKDWWSAKTYATDYSGSDGSSSFSSNPRWNAAYIGTSTYDYAALMEGRGTFYYRVSAEAKADGERFPVVRQSVYRIDTQ